MSRTPTPVHPVTITKTAVTILCPYCGDLHGYPVQDLKPWPIGPGDERNVTAICYGSRARAAAAGSSKAAQELSWGPWMRGGRITIKFKQLPKQAVTKPRKAN